MNPLFQEDEDQESEALFHEMMSVASASECTGLMAAAPMTEAEVQSLREIYNVPPGQKDVLLQSKQKHSKKK